MIQTIVQNLYRSQKPDLLYVFYINTAQIHLQTETAFDSLFIIGKNHSGIIPCIQKKLSQSWEHSSLHHRSTAH